MLYKFSISLDNALRDSLYRDIENGLGIFLYNQIEGYMSDILRDQTMIPLLKTLTEEE